jgi:hypothetical protein
MECLSRLDEGAEHREQPDADAAAPDPELLALEELMRPESLQPELRGRPAVEPPVAVTPDAVQKAALKALQGRRLSAQLSALRFLARARRQVRPLLPLQVVLLRGAELHDDALAAAPRAR